MTSHVSHIHHITHTTLTIHDIPHTTTHYTDLGISRLQHLVRLPQRDPFRLNGHHNVVVHNDIDHKAADAASGRVFAAEGSGWGVSSRGGSHWESVEVIGSQQTACVCSRRELLGVVGSHWESLLVGAVGVNLPTNHLTLAICWPKLARRDRDLGFRNVVVCQNLR